MATVIAITIIGNDMRYSRAKVGAVAIACPASHHFSIVITSLMGVYPMDT